MPVTFYPYNSLISHTFTKDILSNWTRALNIVWVVDLTHLISKYSTSKIRFLKNYSSKKRTDIKLVSPFNAYSVRD